jgi:hypothetical protein
MMTPAALNAGDRISLCWIKTTRLRESKPSPAGEMKEARKKEDAPASSDNYLDEPNLPILLAGASSTPT